MTRAFYPFSSVSSSQVSIPCPLVLPTKRNHRPGAANPPRLFVSSERQMLTYSNQMTRSSGSSNPLPLALASWRRDQGPDYLKARVRVASPGLRMLLGQQLQESGTQECTF